MKTKKLFNNAIRVLLFTNGSVLLAGAMLGPIYALFVRNIGGDLLETSYAYGVFALTAGIVTLFSGKYGDKIKENELIIVVGYLMIGFGFAGYVFIDSLWSLLFVQVLIGAGEAIYSPAFDAIYSKHLDGKRDGEEWGAWEAINYFTIAIGSISGGILVTYFGFNTMFIMMSAICFLSAIYIFLLPRKVL